MAKVVSVDTDRITIELNSGNRKTYPIEAVVYADPKPGDEVAFYREEDGSISIDLPEEEAPAEPQPSKRAKKEKKEGTSGLGIAGFVIGIIAVMFSFIPIVNNIAFFIGILAVIFGLIGALTHKRKGLSIAGIVLGVLAIVITLALQSMWSSALDTVSDQLEEAAASADSQLGNLTGDNTDEILQNSLKVEFGEFTMSKDQYGIVHSSLPITVTNLEQDTKTYSLHLEAVDDGNTRIMDDYVFANDLGAGQSQNFEAFTFVSDDKYDAMSGAGFRIVEASMY